MKLVLLRAFSFCLLLPSCSHFHKKTFVEERFTFETSGCLNKCKHYSVLIVRTKDSVDAALLTGYANVPHTGNFSRKLTKKESGKFWKLIRAASLLNMKDEYDYGAEDSQQRFIFYRHGVNEKQIRFGNDVPEILKKIEAEIEKIVNAPGWVKSE